MRAGHRHGAAWDVAGIEQLPPLIAGNAFGEADPGLPPPTDVIVWRDVGDRQPRELLGAKLLAVYGKVEREGAVVHLLAGRLADLSPLPGKLQTRSRDLH